MLRMGFDPILLIEFLQKTPAFLELPFQGYANTLLFLHALYHQRYQEYRRAIQQPDKDHYATQTIVDPKALDMGEKDFVAELLKPASTLNLELKPYLEILTAQKKVLQTHCNFVGCPTEVIKSIESLPDAKELITQLNALQDFNIRAPFTQKISVYETLNQMSVVLANNINKLSAPIETPVGSAIGPYLGRLNAHRTARYEKAYQVLLEKDMPYTKTYGSDLTSILQKPESRDMELESVISETLENSDMGCAENVVSFDGVTGSAKSAGIILFLDCELQYKETAHGERELIVKSCPFGVIPPEMGASDDSHTTHASLYHNKKYPWLFMDKAGGHDTRPKPIQLLTILSSNVALQTTSTITAIVRTIHWRHFKNRKLIGLIAEFKEMAALFKDPMSKHVDSLRIMITHIPEYNQYQKPFFMKKLAALKSLLEANLEKVENVEERAMLHALSFFLKEGGDKTYF